MSPFIHSILAAPIFHRFLYQFIRIYSGTFRFRIVNEARWQQLIDKGTPVLLCAWHQQFFSAIRPFKRYAKYQPALMISRSRDGAIIAAVARQTGWKTVRGSSSRGGKPALRSMIRHLEGSKLAGHILDGPTGPMGIVKAGVIRLAHAAQATIVPFSVSARRSLYFNSWDRFMLPLPFSRVTLHFGDPVRFSPTNDPRAFEQQRARLEAMMAPCLATGR
jgi:lysophospholipid acyltransferase (LPLAT)-like uncharacterized protein